MADQHLCAVKYFTARTSGPLSLDTDADKEKSRAKLSRQSTYLAALRACQITEVIEGKYSSKPKICKHCNGHYYRHEEKKTDVNIATTMLRDAYEDLFDVAFLVSGDSDLTPPVQAIKDLFPDKKIVVAFPPKRIGKELMKLCHAYIIINKAAIARSQLPSPTRSKKGRQLFCPKEWTKEWQVG